MSPDKITTVLGVVGAGITAATPVLNGVTTGSLHQQDYVNLAISVIFAVLGYYTNKQGVKNGR